MFGGLDFNILTRNIYLVVGFVINLAEVPVPIVTSQRDSLKHTFLCNGWYHTEISSKHEVLAMEDAKGKKKGVGGLTISYDRVIVFFCRKQSGEPGPQ